MNEPDAIQMSIPLIDTTMTGLTSRESFPSSSLKRRASSSFEGLKEDSSRKKVKEERETTEEAAGVSDVAPEVSATLANDLADDLQCGCCAELVYRPVLVNPCQHFFCGR